MNDDLSCYKQAVKVRDQLRLFFWSLRNPYTDMESNDSLAIADRFLKELREYGLKVVPLDMKDRIT